MAIAFPLGLYLPGLQAIAESAIPLLVAGLIFLSCFKTNIGELKSVQFKEVFTFWVLRFFILAAILFYIGSFISADFATAALLLTLMPAGVASPSFSALLGGNVSLAISLTVVSHLACPLLIPFSFWVLTDSVVNVSILELFKTLCLLVFIPIVIHLPLRKTAFREALDRINGGLSVLLIVLMVLAAVSIEREFLLNNPEALFFSLPAVSALYFLYYLLAWLGANHVSKERQLTFTLSSGANNNALAISLAALYFSPAVTIFMVLSEVPWVLSVIVLRQLLGKKQDS
jgi:BASS family bile acid:Na+ symporter